MSKVALCVGIDYYENANCLNQCVADAFEMGHVLDRNGDGSKNFDEVVALYATDERTAISKHQLRAMVEKLFKDQHEIALFYFAGHGAIDEYGGYLCTSEVASVDSGLSMDVLMQIVAKSPAINKIIILDSCHSGTLGQMDAMNGFVKLPPNTTILAACTNDDVAYEGVFTPLVVDALTGGAMNLMGEVTVGSVYAHVDRAMGIWFQRPVFKTNTKNFVCLRKNVPPIDLNILRKLVLHFPKPDYVYPLDPSYEEDNTYDENNPRNANRDHNEKNEKIFQDLRKFYSVNLLVPVDADSMYEAAVRSKSCKLTALGKYYWRLVRTNRI